LAEVDTHFEVAKRLGYIDEAVHQGIVKRVQEVGKMLSALRKSLSRSS
jgi:four helix bundle protein